MFVLGYFGVKHIINNCRRIKTTDKKLRPTRIRVEKDEEEVFSRKQKSLGLAEITFDGKRKPARSVSAMDEIKKVQK